MNAYWFIATTIATVLCTTANPCAQAAVSLGFDTVGSGALVNGNYQKALESLWAQKVIVDSGYWNFKKGVAHFHCKDYRNARGCFLFCVKKDSILVAPAYEFLGDVEISERHPREAVEAYLRAQRDSALQPDHTAAIRAKLVKVVSSNAALVDSVPFLSAWRVDSLTIKRTSAASPFAALDSLKHCTEKLRVDSVLSCFTDSAANEDPCHALSHIEALQLPDSLLLTRRAFSISKAFQRCKAFEKALAWYLKAMARPDFSEEVGEKTGLRHQALLEYGCGHYKQALTLLTQYKKAYGSIPEIILAMARTYRNLGQDTLSLETYSLFTRLFPNDPQLGSVLWNLAMENDQRGNYHKAIPLYDRLSGMKKNSTRAAEALFRKGLCHYKALEYGAASATLGRCMQLYPDAAPYMASLYWKAQATLARNDAENARKQFGFIIRLAPTDYYAFRSRETLTLMGDTAHIPEFDTTTDYIRCKQWLDTVGAAEEETMTRADSIVYQTGCKLALAGCAPSAECYLETVESRYSSNLHLQYDLALVYSAVNNPAASFRIGRRLLWKIPQKNRQAIPLGVQMLSYPLAYYDVVQQAAQSDTVDPLLVLSVIRQESVFNPAVVSRAGAVGLMQLMPATAAKVAVELAQPFTVDSLTRYTVNIRFGTHYLKKLLDQFNGNMVEALAAYNGGPPAIIRWFERNKSKNFDIFIEDIGYDETRGYVKKVLANFWTYTHVMRKVRP